MRIYFDNKISEKNSLNRFINEMKLHIHFNIYQISLCIIIVII